ncbi:MAG: DUF5606 domain-containing protein [Flavobacteriales bacterium]|nr:DUF5606 domain-containing protein [Flavobacteriales bacterium]
MELNDILAISGKSGLFRMISNNGARLIVQSMVDGKKMPVSATHKISALGDIAIFTIEEDVPLGEVFDMMYEKTGGEQGPSHKDDPKELRSFLNELLDELDHDRVYDSDLKKLFQWYNILHANEAFTEEESKEEEELKEEGKEEVESKGE